MFLVFWELLDAGARAAGSPAGSSSGQGRSAPGRGQPGRGAPAATDGCCQRRGGQWAVTPVPAPLLCRGVPAGAGGLGSGSVGRAADPQLRALWFCGHPQTLGQILICCRLPVASAEGRSFTPARPCPTGSSCFLLLNRAAFLSWKREPLACVGHVAMGNGGTTGSQSVPALR